MDCPVCSYPGGHPSDHEPWCPAFMRGAVDLEGEMQLPFGEALEAIADRIEAGELLSDKSMSDREFLAPLLDA